MEKNWEKDLRRRTEYANKLFDDMIHFDDTFKDWDRSIVINAFVYMAQYEEWYQKNESHTEVKDESSFVEETIEREYQSLIKDLWSVCGRLYNIIHARTHGR